MEALNIVRDNYEIIKLMMELKMPPIACPKLPETRARMMSKTPVITANTCQNILRIEMDLVVIDNDDLPCQRWPKFWCQSLERCNSSMPSLGNT